jgi:hypothetical protein
VVSGERYFNKYNPTGDPIAILLRSEIQISNLFYSIIWNHKMLMKTSNINMIGTISIAGNIKAKPEIHVAEKPKPLNPLMIDAINTINKIIKN